VRDHVLPVRDRSQLSRGQPRREPGIHGLLCGQLRPGGDTLHSTDAPNSMQEPGRLDRHLSCDAPRITSDILARYAINGAAGIFAKLR
jgi:hypothetical protein